MSAVGNMTTGGSTITLVGRFHRYSSNYNHRLPGHHFFHCACCGGIDGGDNGPCGCGCAGAGGRGPCGCCCGNSTPEVSP
jgi:hypothetical protein